MTSEISYARLVGCFIVWGLTAIETIYHAVSQTRERETERERQTKRERERDRERDRETERDRERENSNSAHLALVASTAGLALPSELVGRLGS